MPVFNPAARWLPSPQRKTFEWTQRKKMSTALKRK